MFRRRRPLLRAAVVGGGAYVAGKSVARRRADQDAQDAAQDGRIDDLEQQQHDKEFFDAVIDTLPGSENR